jgi:hypothetical protein
MNCLHLFRFVAMTSASGVPEGNRESPAKADGSLAIMPRLTAGTTPSIAPNVAGARCPWLRCIIGIAFVGGGLSNLSAAASEERSRSILPISQTLCEDMNARGVLKPGAPVGCERLRLVKFDYVDFDGRIHDDGEIVVMDAAARYVLNIFVSLRRMRFPIAKARLMNEYNGNDDASMADNNTSAFNVRDIVGGSTLSLHAYGLAIDINPVQNPFATKSGATWTFSPPTGAANANRLNNRPGKPNRSGMAEAVIDVFADNGFLIWGGYWDEPLDYQHFQVSGKFAKQLASLPPDAAEMAFAQHTGRYRICRRTRGQGAEGRVKCIVEADSNGE